MTPDEYILLYEKFLLGQCSPEEGELLAAYNDNFKMQGSDMPAKLSAADKKNRADIYANIRRSVAPKPKVVAFKRVWWLAAAAMLIMCLGIAGLFLENKQQPLQAGNISHKVNLKPIKPGTNTAVLTLANGAAIVLDDAQNGVLAQSGKTAIKKLKNGLIAYSGDGIGPTNAEASLNTITIPRGGQYAVVLPDGTHVWLNSQSSLTYPVAFSGFNRTVSLTGEAYFEVAKNKQLPFIVHTPKASVTVLGTHFNIEAYPDNAAEKATLLEGAVSLSNNASSTLLVPGQQGVTASGQSKIATAMVNTTQVVAWKAGYFIFRDNDIHEIMKQVSRWYDVEVVYEGAVSNKTFGGTYAKNKDINELLKGLELTGLVHFKIEGRRIIVMT